MRAYAPMLGKKVDIEEECRHLCSKFNLNLEVNHESMAWEIYIEIELNDLLFHVSVCMCGWVHASLFGKKVTSITNTRVQNL